MNAHAQIAEITEIGAVADQLAPETPQWLADLGLDEDFLVGLLVKTIYRMGLEQARDVSRKMKIPVAAAAELIEIAQGEELLETVLELGAGPAAETRYSLTGKGRERALEAFCESAYHGPVPVSLDAFARQIAKQSIRNESLARPMLNRALSELTLSRALIEKLGPAVNCGASVLLYGPAGNGKSSIAGALGAAFPGTVYLPHAMMVDKQVITVFDSAVHVRAEESGAPAGCENARGDGPGDALGDRPARYAEGGHDRRFVACRRPAVTAGSELTLDRLELTLNTDNGVYDAPLQLKAAGGVLVVDDFGRQRLSPQELIDRLVIPLERGLDHLSLETGRNVAIPLDALVVFATNMAPKQLVDEAALRRVHHKILVDKPDRSTFTKLFMRTAQQRGLDANKSVTSFVLDELYGKTDGADLAGFHPKFLLDQVCSIASFDGSAPSLSRELLRRAWENLFIAE